MQHLLSKKFVIKSIALVALLGAFSAMSNPLFSLENLERERAALLKVMTDSNLPPDVRQQKHNSIYRRMTDIERMVLRDDRIANSDKVMVKKAFANYDLTFLVHASAEHKTQPLNHWLNTLGVNASSIASSKMGYR